MQHLENITTSSRDSGICMNFGTNHFSGLEAIEFTSITRASLGDLDL